MHELAEREDVIALALHVDYWDYIGWKDQFADPRNAKRQRGYAAMGGRRSIYTPQMIVNGMTDIVGTKPMKLAEAINDHAEMASPVNLTITREGDTLTIRANCEVETDPLFVQVLRYAPERRIDITRGENAGRKMRYANVTEDWKLLTEWDGRTPLVLTSEITGDLPVVVLVQEGRFGPILAAARLR